MSPLKQFCRSLIFLSLCIVTVGAQQPPEKTVNNPIRAAEEQRKTARQNQVNIVAEVASAAREAITIVSDKEEAQGDTVIAVGNVQVSGNGMLVIADRIVYNKTTNDLLAEGDVYFEQEGQKLTGVRLELNVKTKRGSVFEPTGFTDRTPDGTVIIIDAARADKTGADTIVMDNATLTACQEKVPKWTFTARRVRIRKDDRAQIYNAFFKIKNIPVLWLPYASISISKKDRSSGFLLPTSGSSNIKGRTLHLAYFQTLGRSADVLFRTDVYARRGLGFGFDFRARPDEKSRIDLGTFIVQDRLFGEKGEDQGGSSFYVDGVQHFKNGFVAVADVNITSSFNFRQVFSDNIQTAISPEERSIFYVNRNWRSFSFNALFGEQSAFVGRKNFRNGETVFDDQIVKTRLLPSIELNQRSTRIADSFPAYFSFDGALEGIRRSETRGDETRLKSPSVVQRFDFFPRVTFPLKPVAGFTLTPSFGVRSTFYSDSVAPVERRVVGENLLRTYVDFNLDLRPPALAKVFRRRNGEPWFKHIIEPFLAYRRIAGIDRFDRTLRVDERDVIAETNEFEYGVSNRFLVRRAGEDGAPPQPHEYLDVTLSQKYFFDPTFGGALKPCTRERFLENNCARNQFFPINTLTGFSYGGVPRHLSPLNVRARVRPNPLAFADVRLNYDTEFHGLRDLVVGAGINRGIFSLSNSWYYTRRVAVDKRRTEVPFDPSSLPGNQLDFAAFVGNPARGPYGGFWLIYDLRNRDFTGVRRDPFLMNLTTVAGWAWDCCSFQIQSSTFNAGVRNENRYIFSFTLKGIGTFGTENIGQRR